MQIKTKFELGQTVEWRDVDGTLETGEVTGYKFIEMTANPFAESYYVSFLNLSGAWFHGDEIESLTAAAAEAMPTVKPTARVLFDTAVLAVGHVAVGALIAVCVIFDNEDIKAATTAFWTTVFGG